MKDLNKTAALAAVFCSCICLVLGLVSSLVIWLILLCMVVALPIVRRPPAGGASDSAAGELAGLAVIRAWISAVWIFPLATTLIGYLYLSSERTRGMLTTLSEILNSRALTYQFAGPFEFLLRASKHDPNAVWDLVVFWHSIVWWFFTIALGLYFLFDRRRMRESHLSRARWILFFVAGAVGMYFVYFVIFGATHSESLQTGLSLFEALKVLFVTTMLAASATPVGLLLWAISMKPVAGKRVEQLE